MLDRVRSVQGEVLDRAAYHALRSKETDHLTRPIWKLERSQYFHEPDEDPSWQAFLDGDWARVRDVFESERGEARAEAQKYARQGSEVRRLRIVEHPVSPYLLWEMQWFRILVEERSPIRTLAAEKVRDLERDGPLPEVVVDEHALYHVSYDDAWRACGARRIDEPKVMERATAQIAELWERAEPFWPYFRREIAPLTPSA